MRIHIKTTPAKELINFNHLHLMTGVLHKWIGENQLHDAISHYSFSQLRGGKATKKGLDYSDGASFFISSWDAELIKSIIAGIQEDPSMFFGMKVKEIIIKENPDFSEKSHFQVASSIFIQRRLENGKKKFYLYYDAESSELMKETLQRKMEMAGLECDETLSICFDKDYHRKSTKKIDYKKGENVIQLRASWCPVIIEGKPETKAFAWNVGIGNSTGIGFGAIK